MDEDLQTIQVTNRGQQIKNAHRLRRKVEMVNETREMNRDLAQQCREYVQRFEKCVRNGMPFIFYSNNDLVDQDSFMHHVQSSAQYESALQNISKSITSFDILRVLRKPQDILTMLKDNFILTEKPNVTKAKALELSIDTTEEYQYPLKEDWQILKRCVRLYNGIIQSKEQASAAQAEGSGSKGKRVDKKVVASGQQPISIVEPTIVFAPVPIVQLESEPPVFQPQVEISPRQQQGASGSIKFHFKHPLPPQGQE